MICCKSRNTAPARTCTWFGSITCLPARWSTRGWRRQKRARDEESRLRALRSLAIFALTYSFIRSRKARQEPQSPPRTAKPTKNLPCDKLHSATSPRSRTPEASKKYNSTALTVLLLGSIALAGTGFPYVSASSGISPEPANSQKNKEEKSKDKKGQQQMSSAEVERETGRRALRRGEAGEALVHLENALRLYKGGDRWGEAATHDLLGDLYDQQGRYGLALEHFQSALKIYTDTKHAEYNTNLMLAKIGNMYYRQGDFPAARSAYDRMEVKKP